MDPILLMILALVAIVAVGVLTTRSEYFIGVDFVGRKREDRIIDPLFRTGIIDPIFHNRRLNEPERRGIVEPIFKTQN